MEVESFLEAVEDALAKHGRAEIFNSDQGSQFTSDAFTGRLLDNGNQIRMDCRAAWRGVGGGENQRIDGDVPALRQQQRFSREPPSDGLERPEAWGLCPQTPGILEAQ